jgi:hypothetical protein
MEAYTGSDAPWSASCTRASSAFRHSNCAGVSGTPKTITKSHAVRDGLGVEFASHTTRVPAAFSNLRPSTLHRQRSGFHIPCVQNPLAESTGCGRPGLDLDRSPALILFCCKAQKGPFGPKRLRGDSESTSLCSVHKPERPSKVVRDTSALSWSIANLKSAGSRSVAISQCGTQGPIWPMCWVLRTEAASMCKSRCADLFSMRALPICFGPCL